MSDLLDAATAKVLAPFGSWEMDKQKADLNCAQCLFLSNLKSMWIHDSNYFVKIVEYDVEQEAISTYFMAQVPRELKMMLLAGSCSIEPVGRVYDNGTLCGIVMRLGIVVTRRIPLFFFQYPPNFDSLPSPRRIIDALTKLVSHLHSMDVIHGDIKPANIVFCPFDGELRFCDFGSAVFGSNNDGGGSTTHYNSPFRETMTEAPLSKKDDLYATGISIWELYTGRIPFKDIGDEELVEELVRSGFHPDLCAVDDPAVRQLIVSYLDLGNPPLPAEKALQGTSSCIVADVTFADCVATPPHSSRKFVRCKSCVDDLREEDCPNLYHASQLLGCSQSAKCTTCHSATAV